MPTNENMLTKIDAFDTKILRPGAGVYVTRGADPGFYALIEASTAELLRIVAIDTKNAAYTLEITIDDVVKKIYTLQLLQIAV